MCIMKNRLTKYSPVYAMIRYLVCNRPVLISKWLKGSSWLQYRDNLCLTLYKVLQGDLDLHQK